MLTCTFPQGGYGTFAPASKPPRRYPRLNVRTNCLCGGWLPTRG